MLFQLSGISQMAISRNALGVYRFNSVSACRQPVNRGAPPRSRLFSDQTALEKEPFAIIACTLPNGAPAVGHMAISDPSDVLPIS